MRLKKLLCEEKLLKKRERVRPMNHKSVNEIDEKIYRRFDERNQLFCRTDVDKEYKNYKREVYERNKERIEEKKPGYARIDYALESAAWTLYETYKVLPKELIRGLGYYDCYKSLPKYEEEDREKMSEIIKRVASFFGAVLTGITPIDERWVYSHSCSGEKITIPEEYTSAIVMAVEMDPVGLGSSPSVTSATATALGYSQMTFLVMHLGEFIRSLGYRTIDMLNDTALSIPLAIHAGLGKLGRNGLLVTEEYGSRVRICKIFTDLPLTPDEPPESGILEYCKTCKKCAEACEADAISFDDEPSFETHCPENNSGVKKWYLDAEKCYDYWYENGADCTTCITVCPFSQVKENEPKKFWGMDL
jgi:ferredoxin